jgi:hypothetical protein
MVEIHYKAMKLNVRYINVKILQGIETIIHTCAFVFKCVKLKLFFISSSVVRFEVFTAVTVKNGVFWDVTPVALLRTDVSEEPSASFIRVTRIGELGTTLAATSNRRKLRRNTKWYFLKEPQV